ncbi:MAG: hypothetical protein GXP55_15550 [Deltaproteobacteria bacterium]|nr:hypothetical protein [Deltaproteobacteria bacterium]
MPEHPLRGLPGAERALRGLADARDGIWSAEALVIAMAPTRLRQLGLEVPHDLPSDAELALYAQLARDGVADPYARYNALLREFDSFLESLTARRRREEAAL